MLLFKRIELYLKCIILLQSNRKMMNIDTGWNKPQVTIQLIPISLSSPTRITPGELLALCTVKVCTSLLPQTLMNAAAGRTSASVMLTASTSPAVTGVNAQLDTSCRLAEPAWVRRELFATYSRGTCGRC